jgi:hypothetical protein
MEDALPGYLPSYKGFGLIIQSRGGDKRRGNRFKGDLMQPPPRCIAACARSCGRWPVRASARKRYVRISAYGSIADGDGRRA